MPAVPGVCSGRLAYPTHVAQSARHGSVAVPARVGQKATPESAQSAATLGSQQVPSGSAPGAVAAALVTSFEPAAQVWSFAGTSLHVHMVSSQHAVMSAVTVKSHGLPAQFVAEFAEL